jgi:hypothetical protein
MAKGKKTGWIGWTKDQCGNPKGRPKIQVDVREIKHAMHEKTVLSLGIKGKYVNAAMHEASRLVNENTPFDKAIEKVANDHSEWKDGWQEEKARPNIAALSGTNYNLAGRKIRRNTKNT